MEFWSSRPFNVAVIVWLAVRADIYFFFCCCCGGVFQKSSVVKLVVKNSGTGLGFWGAVSASSCSVAETKIIDPCKMTTFCNLQAVLMATGSG